MVNGLRPFFSLIVMTIFSRSSGVICLSLPRLWLRPESCLRTRGLVRGADVDAPSLSDSMASSPTELMLPDRSGIDIAVAVVFASPESQQKVYLFHSLQLRFSKPRPSSTRTPPQNEFTKQEEYIVY
jgi:hypothetical protein